MSSNGLDGRDRDKNGQIRAKNGSTRVETIRAEYGQHVLQGVRSDAKLDTMLQRTGAPSLSKLLNPHRRKG